MPWPMVHFAIAQQLGTPEPTPSLLLGSIAPDAVHVRGNITREQKGITHLVNEDLLPDANRIRENYLLYVTQKPGKEWIEFVYGYFAHIYTDLRWVQTLYADYKKENKADNESLRFTYNQEVSQLEFEIIRSQHWAGSVLNKLTDSMGHALAPFVDKSEVEQYRTIKLEWLLEEGNEPKIELIYFTLDKVERFVQNTAAELSTLLAPEGIHVQGG
ncbi:hypothetical protein JNUCC32_07110 [Paenibacillus sp. JNUCC32]|uniref:hypothetical protein n=1 Tax=Paenibacillus TaxID=44249 RepID=UPI0017881C9B|nr:MULTISPECIES: hypothetical protein [Paenibacillus]QOT11787.1 hypothetical protein JNUCC32_07110 [Paenibacillus sp. JNUCC-32]GIP03738.1 hypothetical protein J28TS4_21450 [Paenibacillus lautus]